MNNSSIMRNVTDFRKNRRRTQTGRAQDAILIELTLSEEHLYVCHRVIHLKCSEVSFVPAKVTSISHLFIIQTS